MHKISKLPLEIQNRICAGEVIVSPYNVIKELVENSIDAGSLNISVVVSKDNLNLEVHDDGCGIQESDFKNLALPHFTSKFNDSYKAGKLFSCGENSFGFRGEALASIKCVSNLTIKSKTKDSEWGFSRNFMDEIVTFISMNNGTSVYIKNLFFNNKIREKCFYKKLSVFKSMNDLINSFALQNPKIRFQFNEKFYIYDDSFNSLIKNCTENFGDILDDFKNQTPILKNKDDPITQFRSRQMSAIYNISSIRHFTNDFLTMIFTPTMINFKNFQFILFINGRLVYNSNIKASISKKYFNILPKGRHPFVFLELWIPTKHVDVNIHPSKKEILIEYEDKILEIINLILDEGLNEQKSLYKSGTIINTKNTDLVYKEYNTLEDCCFISKQYNEYKLLSLNKIKDEILEIDKSFIKDLVYVGVADLPNKSLLVQYNQYLMSCDLDIIIPILIYQYFVHNFGNLHYYKSCNIKNDNIGKYKEMLKEYFLIEVDDFYIKQVPVIGNSYGGNMKDWENFNISNLEEEAVFREIFNKLVYIYRDLSMDRNIFSIMKRDLRCTKEVLRAFSILKSLKDLYKCFERC